MSRAQWGFRLRLRLGRVRIDTQETRLALTDPARHGETVRLASAKGGQPITEHQELPVSGKAYESAEAAQAAAERWQGILEKAFARNKIGANFGRTISDAWFSPALLEEMEAASGQRVLPERHGITVYELDPEPPMFLEHTIEGYPGRLPEHVLAAVNAANESGVRIETEREQLAYELYGASFSASYPDSRFMLLMMAMETLSEQKSRPPAAVVHIDRLIADTAAADLDEGEIASLTRHLEQLRVESVGRAGRQLVKSKLSGRRYRDESPQDFFQSCYDFRSQLVHGEEQRPSGGQVDDYSVHLEVLLTDLLGLGLPEPG